MEKLKQRWGIESNWDIFFIIIAFSINGSFSSYIARPLTEAIGLDYETTNAWVYWPIRILLIFVVYQTTLPIVGWCVGQFKFFWAMEKKMLKRMGLKRFFKDDEDQ
ncbi:DUF6787 family protein [Flavicella sp.]|uniref:DUF6787 family protein n=1 Tax=Flavicella sp. TaxID=2957742 RepID=UPI00260BE49D|nr:DUF6787 family protein [Flavicella sp.]MDG1806212.1 diacylglyceryl transferase [Flavicella sp.]MDG2280427.1 diacylglyceryl transferase [Flavicella sp.]